MFIIWGKSSSGSNLLTPRHPPHSRYSCKRTRNFQAFKHTHTYTYTHTRTHTHTRLLIQVVTIFKKRMYYIFEKKNCLLGELTENGREEFNSWGKLCYNMTVSSLRKCLVFAGRYISQESDSTVVNE